jgi:lipoprotein-anchoring transpeptidase ErfK/SrfK
MTTRRPAPHRIRLAAVLAAVFALTLSSCTSGVGEVVVTVTTTPGATGAQVTAPGGDAGTGDGAATRTGTAAPPASQTPASGASQTPQPSKNLASVIRVISKPAFGTKNVGPKDPVTVTVFSGKVKEMAVTGDDGTTIAGRIGDDQASYTLTEKLAYGTTYTFAGTAVAPDNSVKQISGTLSTVKPESTVQALFQIPENATVGVGAPIVISFYPAISDKAAAQKALTITTSRGDVQGSWGWLQDEDFSGLGVGSQVHFRPKEYWPANTKVTVKADLAGVNYGNNWGREDLVRHFSIGRSLVLKADVSTKHLVVWKDGTIFRNYPVSYGRESEPGKTTVSGTHIVQEKYPDFKMTNPQFGYYNLPEKWAIRINNNGEFIHHNAAVEKAGLLGKENVSHGCVNMGEKDAKELFDMVVYGDPVEISGTTQKMSEKDYNYDWKYDWDQWKTLSALG